MQALCRSPLISWKKAFTGCSVMCDHASMVQSLIPRVCMQVSDKALAQGRPKSSAARSYEVVAAPFGGPFWEWLWSSCLTLPQQPQERLPRAPGAGRPGCLGLLSERIRPAGGCGWTLQAALAAVCLAAEVSDSSC